MNRYGLAVIIVASAWVLWIILEHQEPGDAVLRMKLFGCGLIGALIFHLFLRMVQIEK